MPWRAPMAANPSASASWRPIRRRAPRPSAQPPKVTLLVNCAGLAAGCSDFDRVEEQNLGNELVVNMQAPMYLTRALFPGMDLQLERGAESRVGLHARQGDMLLPWPLPLGERWITRAPGMTERDVSKVARAALTCTRRGRRWGTNGWINWFNLMTSGLFPLRMILRIAAKLQWVQGCRP
mmetsp:Transcript_40601/g.130629  ORF Transcript_40601/g.130629 Transcript_40601/m.130629 type:complete len:180 (+) Transcript_40601:262-801(+)